MQTSFFNKNLKAKKISRVQYKFYKRRLFTDRRQPKAQGLFTPSGKTNVTISVFISCTAIMFMTPFD